MDDLICWTQKAIADNCFVKIEDVQTLSEALRRKLPLQKASWQLMIGTAIRAIAPLRNQSAWL